MQRFAFLVFGLLLGVGGYATAAGIHGASGYYVVSASGLISRSGSIVAGKDFTVAHPQRGEYILTFEQSYFGTSSCAELVVEGVHSLILSHVDPNCSGSVLSFDVRIHDLNGNPADHSFGFVAVGTQP